MGEYNYINSMLNINKNGDLKMNNTKTRITDKVEVEDGLSFDTLRKVTKNRVCNIVYMNSKGLGRYSVRVSADEHQVERKGFNPDEHISFRPAFSKEFRTFRIDKIYSVSQKGELLYGYLEF